MCYRQTMTDKGVNIEVPTSHLTLEEVVGPQFETMDMARLYRVAEAREKGLDYISQTEHAVRAVLLARPENQCRSFRPSPAMNTASAAPTM